MWCWNAAISAPALNARPDPVMTTARTAGSSSIRSSTPTMAPSSSLLSAFSFSGRFSVSSATAPLSSKLITSDTARPLAASVVDGDARDRYRPCKLTGRYYMAASALPTKERIVAAGSKLFYAEGIGRVSMDAVAEKAGVTKRTLYYHFRSKDDLVAAYLDSRDQPNLLLFQGWFDATQGGLAEKVRGIFTNLATSALIRSGRGAASSARQRNSRTCRGIRR